MNSGILWQGLSSLTKKEQKKFLQFVRSPYFNQRKDLIRLTEYLLECIFDLKLVPSREKVYDRITNGDSFNDQNLRLKLSYLTKLFEKFLIVESSNFMDQSILIKQLIARNLIKHYKIKAKHTCRRYDKH